MKLSEEYSILKTVKEKNKLTPLFEQGKLTEEDVLKFYETNFTLFRSVNNRFDSDNPQISDNFELTDKGTARLKVIEKELS